MPKQGDHTASFKLKLSHVRTSSLRSVDSGIMALSAKKFGEGGSMRLGTPRRSRTASMWEEHAGDWWKASKEVSPVRQFFTREEEMLPVLTEHRIIKVNVKIHDEIGATFCVKQSYNSYLRSTAEKVLQLRYFSQTLCVPQQ